MPWRARSPVVRPSPLGVRARIFLRRPPPHHAPPVTDRIAQLNGLLAGRYVVQRELGAGGMATVYLAEDVKHRRKVAIKVLRDDLSASVGGARFLREIEIAAQLQHPNILPLLDSGDADGLLYYVMPFVEGQSLRQRLDREHELPVGDAVKLLIEVVDALAHAHEHGVVHRDIKPDNVMLSGRHALVTDFGVARAVSEAKGGTITTLGIALGTPAYMSPEQATADPSVDHRADIYAVGVMAYELLAGRLPFASGSAQQILAAQVTEKPEPVAKHRPAVNPLLAQAVMRCLEKRPADRWQSAAELLAVLEPLATPSGGTAPTEARIPAVTAPRGGTWKIVAGIAVVAAVAGAAYVATRPRGPSLVLGKSTQLTTDAGLQIDPALSPDGKFVAYAAGTSSSMRIYVRPIGGGRTIALTDDSTAVEYEPRWSPDGTQVMFLTRGGVSVAPALGGPSRNLIAAGATPVTTASWSPDGHEIVFVRLDSLMTTTGDGQSTRLVFKSGDAQEGLHSCRWSPNGALIACVLGNTAARVPGEIFANKAPSRIVVVPSAGGTPIPATEPGVLSQSPEWSPSGDRLYFISDRDGTFDAYEAVIDGSGTVRGAPHRVTTGLNARSISIAASAPRVAYGVYTERANIHAVPIPASGTVQVTNAEAVTTGTQVIESVRTSRDGKWILYDSDRDGKANIYRVPVSGGQPEQLTHESFDVFAPDLSPDGKLLAYHSWRRGNRDIEVRPLDGGPVEFVATGPRQESYPAWSPDGTALLFFDQQGDFSVFVTKRLGAAKWSVPKKVIASGSLFGGRADWSPDGKWIVSIIGDRVVTAPADSGEVRTLARLPAARQSLEFCQYGTDGKSVYCKSHDDRGRALLYAIPASGGTPRVIVTFPDLAHPSYRRDFGVDAKKFYFVIQDRQSNVWIADIAR